jgi:hypothetical protein
MEHPEVCMPHMETHYFEQNYEKGLEWYHNFYKECSNENKIGEKTASYLHYDSVVFRIKESLPNVKLIFCVRDPIDRMYSHYAMSTSRDNAIKTEELLANVKPGSQYLEWGMYARQLSPFFENFPRENILVQIYEDKDIDPSLFMSEIYRFIDVDSDFKAPSTKIRTKLGQFEHNNRLWRPISKIMLHPRGPFVLRSIYTKIRPNAKKNILSENVYQKLSQHYLEDLVHLEELIDRDLSIWPTRRFAEL